MCSPFEESLASGYILYIMLHDVIIELVIVLLDRVRVIVY